MNILVVGGSGGIGAALAEALGKRPEVSKVIATYHRHPPERELAGVVWQHMDVTQPESAGERWPSDTPLDLMIYAAGVLHDGAHQPEKTIRRFDPDLFRLSMEVNVLPVLALAQALHPAFKLSAAPRLVAISARVGSIGENRKGGWYSYRCSKAALNMAIRTLGVEWRMALPRGAVAALHPGTTDTGLSRPFQANVPEGKLFSTRQTADYLLAVIDQLSAENSGEFWSWDGSLLPW